VRPDPFDQPVDRLLLALRLAAPDAYRLVPGAGGAPDAWLCRCPLHPDAGFTLTVVDRGDSRDPLVSCRAGCPAVAVEVALGLDREHQAEAERRARTLMWARSWRRAAA
jgi:hypothetical protein